MLKSTINPMANRNYIAADCVFQGTVSKAEVSKLPHHIKELRPLGTVDWSREAYNFGISGRPLHFKALESSINVLNKTRHSAIMLSNQNDIKYTFKDTI